MQFCLVFGKLNKMTFLSAREDFEVRSLTPLRNVLRKLVYVAGLKSGRTYEHWGLESADELGILLSNGDDLAPIAGNNAAVRKHLSSVVAALRALHSARLDANRRAA